MKFYSTKMWSWELRWHTPDWWHMIQLVQNLQSEFLNTIIWVMHCSGIAHADGQASFQGLMQGPSTTIAGEMACLSEFAYAGSQVTLLACPDLQHGDAVRQTKEKFLKSSCKSRTRKKETQGLLCSCPIVYLFFFSFQHFCLNEASFSGIRFLFLLFFIFGLFIHFWAFPEKGVIWNSWKK